MKTVEERFLAKVDRTGECWLWVGGFFATGYGTFWMDGKAKRASRCSYELFRGPIPEGMVVMHLCDTPACVNPGHLRLGTSRDNSRDMASKGRDQNQNKGKTACLNGHPFDQENTYYRPDRPGLRECRKCKHPKRGVAA